MAKAYRCFEQAANITRLRERCNQSSAFRPNKRRFRRDTIFEFPVKCNLPAGFFLLLSGGGHNAGADVVHRFHRFYARAVACKTRPKGLECVSQRAPPKIINEVSREQAPRFSPDTKITIIGRKCAACFLTWRLNRETQSLSSAFGNNISLCVENWKLLCFFFSNLKRILREFCVLF